MNEVVKTTTTTKKSKMNRVKWIKEKIINWWTTAHPFPKSFMTFVPPMIFHRNWIFFIPLLAPPKTVMGYIYIYIEREREREREREWNQPCLSSFVERISSELINLLQPNLVWGCIVINWSVTHILLLSSRSRPQWELLQSEYDRVYYICRFFCNQT